ncbi:AMP-binding protein [Gordonia jinghuaiqii]|uniref:AMP-binding protein n=1 Tax=Gordonia jinghuaiqii TaxID=2758710 RepID=A0A7D7RQF8_9ACTN|nr:AMP-binding protein [Gordonia jinghuaiqii]MCR5978977.1 AMP-binding protein [Gordonia jinghuaiqii]QMT01693.1 AMP-binding protein [Gordonia jinghuaiqii]
MTTVNPDAPEQPDGGSAPSETVVALWRRSATANPDAVAIRTPESSITYREALAHTDDRGRAIAAAVAEPGRPVAVDIESDVESVLSIFAVLTSGHPVILLDPFLPDDRRDHILDLSGARRLTPAAIAALPSSAAPLPVVGPDDPGVLVFTSGSTGAPKGVVHPQRAGLAQALDGRDFMGFGPADRVAALLPLSFGAGIDCLTMALFNGATLLLWDVRRRTTIGLREWLAHETATTVHCTPSLLRSWLAGLGAADEIPSVRLLSTCGEPVHHGDVAQVRATVAPQAVFCSWSGASELADLAFNFFPAGREVPTGAIPVGAPASKKHIRIVDDEGNDVPAGTAGEVVVESGYISLGYFNNPQLTAEKYTELPDGRRRFRTGDLGRFDDEGQLRLLGRRDDAVKIRGYLVEPIEVEAALRALPWTVDAVVTADREAARLTAHVAVDPAKWTPSPAEIRTALAKTLAPWMIPRDVVVLDALPRNERGKVDRAALPPPPPRAPEPVRGPTEAALMHIWCGILELDTVGRNEDFVSLGGDSLAAATMLTELRERWLVDISTADFAGTPTIAGLAELLDDAHRDRARSASGATITRLRTGTGAPLFLMAGAGTPAASLLPLAREIDGDPAVFGLQAYGLEGRGRADRSIRAAARRAIADIRSVQPEGPYRLGGYSFGGFVMLEAASILRADGQVCDPVIVLDSRFEPQLVRRVGGRMTEGTGTAGPAALPDRTGAATERTTPSRSQSLQILWTRLAMRGLVATAGLWTLPTTLQWNVFWDLGRDLIRRHRPTPYAGAVTLVKAADNPDHPDTWARLVTGELHTVTVPGDHHAMMRAPHVTATAAAVAAALENKGL